MQMYSQTLNKPFIARVYSLLEAEEGAAFLPQSVRTLTFCTVHRESTSGWLLFPLDERILFVHFPLVVFRNAFLLDCLAFPALAHLSMWEPRPFGASFSQKPLQSRLWFLWQHISLRCLGGFFSVSSQS